MVGFDDNPSFPIRNESSGFATTKDRFHWNHMLWSAVILSFPTLQIPAITISSTGRPCCQVGNPPPRCATEVVGDSTPELFAKFHEPKSRVYPCMQCVVHRSRVCFEDLGVRGQAEREIIQNNRRFSNGPDWNMLTFERLYIWLQTPVALTYLFNC